MDQDHFRPAEIPRYIQKRVTYEDPIAISESPLRRREPSKFYTGLNQASSESPVGRANSSFNIRFPNQPTLQCNETVLWSEVEPPVLVMSPPITKRVTQARNQADCESELYMSASRSLPHQSKHHLGDQTTTLSADGDMRALFSQLNTFKVHSDSRALFW